METQNLTQTRTGWKLYRASKARSDIDEGPMIDWFYSTGTQTIPKAKRILKKHRDYMFGNFILIDEENGQVISFHYCPRNF